MVYTTTLAILGLALVLIAPRIAMEILHFSKNGPVYLYRSYHQTKQILDHNGIRILATEREVFPILHQMADSYAKDIFGAFTTSLDVAGRNLMNTALSLANFALFPIFFYYGLARLHLIHREICNIVPPQFHRSLDYFIKIADKTMGGYIRGQLIVCVTLGSLYATGLWMVGLPYGLVVGYLAGFFNLIPYLGFASGTTMGIFITFISGGDVTLAIAVAGVFIACQLIESLLITPKIVGKSVGLDPLITLLALIIGGNLFGFAGLLFSIPTAGIINRIYKDYLHGHLRFPPIHPHD